MIPFSGTMSTRITLLGTGGGRHATIYQTRSTGGFVLDSFNRMNVDPGPGALVNMKAMGYDPADTDCVFISHCHPDHYSDAEVLIEGMCKGGVEKRGTVVGSETVLKGVGIMGPCVSPYHQALAGECRVVAPGDDIDVDGTGVRITKAAHSDPTTVGAIFRTADGIVSYVSDTSYSDELADQYAGSRVAIISVTTPDDKRIPYHMCTEDAIRFVGRIRPELTIIVHMGIHMIGVGPEGQARKVSDATGCRVIAGKDLMTVDIGNEITVR